MAGRSPHRSEPWGWHRLSDGEARRLVADSGVGAGDLVLDVGAGTGAITLPLLATGARVVAVETHPGRLRALRRLAEGPGQGRLVVARADAADLHLPRRPFHVVANPPFAVTTALMRRLLHPGSRMVGAQLVLQDGAARRWARRHPEVHLVRRVPRRAFTPPSRVDCRVVTVRRG